MDGSLPEGQLRYNNVGNN